MPECECPKRSRYLLWFCIYILAMDSCIGCFPNTVHRNETIMDSKQDIQRMMEADQRHRATQEEEMKNLRGRIYHLENKTK